jgi:hypothetical protein
MRCNIVILVALLGPPRDLIFLYVADLKGVHAE